MKRFLAIVVVSMGILCAINSHASAQSDTHIYTATTFKIAMPSGGSEAERDSLVAEYLEWVVKKNDKVLSAKNYRHSWGSNSSDWLVISEFKSMADLAASEKIDDELMKKHWPDEKKRREFNRRFFSYFPNHSDEIYSGDPKFDK
jgi:hypothetical protein